MFHRSSIGACISSWFSNEWKYNWNRRTIAVEKVVDESFAESEVNQQFFHVFSVVCWMKLNVLGVHQKSQSWAYSTPHFRQNAWRSVIFCWMPCQGMAGRYVSVLKKNKSFMQGYAIRGLCCRFFWLHYGKSFPQNGMLKGMPRVHCSMSPWL